ncbi:MAG: hypothetical protein HYV13_02785 [Candidatus Doudnabacteria bacterium]|nr:hypothetical protein [Candidatus Doudnabacteria bacterium]
MNIDPTFSPDYDYPHRREVEIKVSCEDRAELVIESRRPVLRPAYPSWVRKRVHRELEETSPKKFYTARFELWLAPGQDTDAGVTGHAVYEALKAGDLLAGCAGLFELQIIRPRGKEFYERYFLGKAVFGWRWVVEHYNGRLFVPYLGVYRGSLGEHWHCLDDNLNYVRPALRFGMPEASK